MYLLMMKYIDIVNDRKVREKNIPRRSSNFEQKNLIK